MLVSELPKMQKIDRLTNQGLEAFQTGNFLRALTKFEGCLRIRKHDQKIREAAAYSAVRAEDWASAAKHWRVVLREDPRRAGPYQQFINALLQDLRFDEALTFCETYKPLQNKQQLGLRDNLVVRVHLMAGNTLQAQRLANARFEAAPETFDLMTMAKWFFDAKVFAEALHWLDQMPDAHPKAAQAQMMRARIAYERKQWDKAESEFQDLIQNENPSLVQTANVFLARIAGHQDDQRLAEQRWRIVLDAAPEHAEAMTFLIRTALTDQNHAHALLLINENWRNLDPIRRVQLKARALGATDRQAARAFFIETLEQQPSIVALRRDYAHFLLDASDWDAGREQVAICLKQAPDDISVHKLHLRALQDTAAPFDKQLTAAKQASALAPRDVSLINTVGNLLVRINCRDLAVEHYQRAVETVPDAAVLWRNLAYHTAMEVSADAAVEVADRALAYLGTSTSNDLVNAAWIYQAAGDIDCGVAQIRRALEIDPSSLRAQQIALDLFMNVGDYSAAWERVLKIDALQVPRRDAKTAHAAAQCLAAFRAVAAAQGDPFDHPVTAPTGEFPEQLFHAIAKRAVPDLSGDRAGIVHLTSNLGPGGAERQVACVMQSLTDKPMSNDKVTLVVNSLDPIRSNDFFLEDVVKSGVGILDLDDERAAGQIREVLSHSPALARQVQSLAALPAEVSRVAIPFFAHLVKTRPRVVHLWQDAINIAGGMAAMAAGVPHIVLCTRSTHPVEMRRYRRYLREGYLALFKYSGQVSVLNNSANGAQDYAGWLTISPLRIDLFYNGYDFDAIRQRGGAQHGLRAKLGLTDRARVIGGVMRFSAEKRPNLWVETLIAAVQAQDEVHGLIIGDGPMRKDLMKQVDDLGLGHRIHFVGRKSPIEPWMSAMDILFLSSLTEGLPNVLIEAQALGIPVATMNVGGAPEAMQDGLTGIVMNEAAPDVLAHKIMELLNDGPRLAGMARAAGLFVDHKFSIPAMRNTLQRCYDPVDPEGYKSC